MSELSREARMPQLIIDRPELQAPVGRTVSRLLTLLAWTIYLYLWLPLITLAAWWVAVRIGIREVGALPAPYFVDAETLWLLGKLALLAVVLLIGWAEYNRVRFQGRERRGALRQVSLDESAQALGSTPEIAAAVRRARRATVVLDDNAAVVDLRLHEP